MHISIADLMLVTFVLVDNWYQHKGARLLNRTVGSKPEFSDSEMLTLMLAIDFFEFTSERRFVAFIRANYLALFPKLLEQSQYNRRARSLRYLLNELRKDWAAELGVQFEEHFLLDTTPVIAVGYRRDKRHSDFRGSAEYGYCSARRLKYFGYKLVMLTTLDGTPYTFELVPANTDEREAADEILDTLPPDSNAWSDKGRIALWPPFVSFKAKVRRDKSTWLQRKLVASPQRTPAPADSATSLRTSADSPPLSPWARSRTPRATSRSVSWASERFA